MQKLKKIIENAFYIVFPDNCIVCTNILENYEHKICDNCIGKINEVEDVCLKCGNPLELTQDWCGACRPKKVYYEKLFVVYYYNDTMKFLLKQIKFRPSDKVFENLEFFYNFLSTNSLVINEFEKILKHLDFILPMPIHITREEKRGYNQSSLFSGVLSNLFDLPVNDNIIKKTKNTDFFYNLGKRERLKQVENAFEVLDENVIYKKNILIVDDISTTGATLNEISKILLNNGANNVFCFCIAHGN